MNPPKAIWAAIVFGILIISVGFLVGQVDNFFGKAGHGGAHITGTIVLSDKANLTGNNYFIGNIALPGTSCDVILTHCFEGLYSASDGGVYFAPALYKSRLITRNASNNWDLQTNVPQYTEYVPISQPIGAEMDIGGTVFSRKCFGSEYRSVGAGNYVVGIVQIKKDPSALPFELIDSIPKEGDSHFQSIQISTVSYDCTA